jgi:hypothetical protein
MKPSIDQMEHDKFKIVSGETATTTTKIAQSMLIDDYTTTNVTYICKAKIGSSTASAVWSVMKIDTTTGTRITWADGNDLEDNVADNRASLTYS